MFGQGKNLPLIAMAHEIPYVATATVAELRDLEAKVEKAMTIRGARYLHVFVPCPLGWGSASSQTVSLARLAKETGIFPVFEAEHGEVTGVSPIRRQLPVEDYLRPQRRFAHLFSPTPRHRGHRADPGRRGPQHPSVRAAPGPRPRGEPLMDKPFAITLDVGSSLANKTGSWRTERPVYLDRLPPCNQACPAGENIQEWLYQAEDGGYEAAWRAIMRDNPLPAVMGRVCYHPCQTACNRAQLDEAVGINSVERFLGDLALERGWTVPVEVESSGRSVLVVGSGPSGLSAAYHLTLLGHAVTIVDAGPKPGGMMRFGIPSYRLPRTVIDAEIARIEAMGVTVRTGHRVDDVLAEMRDGGYDAAFLAVGAHIGKRAYIPAGETAKILDAVTRARQHGG